MAIMASLAGWEAEARKRTALAVAELSRRDGLAPPTDREPNRARTPEPSEKTVTDQEAVAALAETVLRLHERVDALQLQMSNKEGQS